MDFGKHKVNGRRCKICQHPERFRAELMMASDASIRAVAKKFEMSPDALFRHWRNHVSDERKAQLIAGPVKLSELAERAAAEGLSLLDYLSLIRSTLLTQFGAAASAGDRHGTATIAGRLLECLREQGRLTGELRAAGGGTNITTNVMVLSSPAFAELQRMLLERLAAYPEARAAVVAGLRDLDARLGGGGAVGAPGPSPALPSSIPNGEIAEQNKAIGPILEAEVAA
jgi:transposase-like protein